MSKDWDEILMSHANNSNEIRSDADTRSVNDNQRINDTASGEYFAYIRLIFSQLCQFSQCLSPKYVNFISLESVWYRLWIVFDWLQLQLLWHKTPQCIKKLAFVRKKKRIEGEFFVRVECHRSTSTNSDSDWQLYKKHGFLFSFILGASETVQTLQDHKIEEKDNTACDTDTTKNDDDSNNSNPLNATYLNQLKEHSMAIYYGWQIVCLLIFMFTAYEALQTV